MQKNGMLFSVGVGPGDPELLTLKAVRIIEGCEVIAAPRTRSGEMLALDIVRRAVAVDGKTILPLDFAMARDPAARERDHRGAAERIAPFLAAGRDVAMLNLGDVSVYATCGYVRELLKAKGFESVMVPGVTSFCAVAARLDIALTDGDEALHILPAGAPVAEDSLDLPGTKVLMKSGTSLPRVLDLLERKNLTSSAAMAANCGLPNEIVCRDMRAVPEDAGYFATIVVKDAKE